MGAMRWVLAAVAYCGSVRALLAPLAYTSKPLRPLPVKQVCIAPEKTEDDPTEWHDEIRRRAARCGVGYRKGTATVVFASEPSREDLAVLCGDDGMAGQVEDAELEPANRNDWSVFKSLLCSSLLSYLRDCGVEVEKDRGSLWIPRKTTQYPQCKLEQGIGVEFTKCFNKEGECRLLVNPELKSKIRSTASVYSMLKRVPLKDLEGLRVKSVYPKYSGTLCKPKEPGAISSARDYLGGKSLLDHNKAQSTKRRRRLADEDDPEVDAVGLRTSKGSILDFPPQILDQVIYMKDTPVSAQNKMKFSPDAWKHKITTTFKDLVSEWFPPFLADDPFLNNKVFLKTDVLALGRLPCAESTTPRDLSLGPELPSESDAQIIPVYRATPGDNAEVKKVASRLDSLLKRWKSSNRIAPRDKWIEFDTEDVMKNQLRSLSEESQDYVVLACFTNGEDRRRIKDAAALSNFVSQGVNLTTASNFKTKNIALGLNSKLDGQAELCRDLAKPGTVFISYDVSRQRDIGLAVGVTLLGHDGRIASGPEDSRPQKGEALDTEFLEKSLLESVKMCERQRDSLVHRVVVYRDGRFLKDERKVCLETLSGYEVDLVELTKSGPDRLRFIEFDKNKTTSSQPLPGSYVTLRERVANLVTAATVPSGLAQPIVVSHVHGDATFDDILTEVYKSAAIRTYSDQHTRLPAHSHYADRRAGAELAEPEAKHPTRPGLHAA